LGFVNVTDHLLNPQEISLQLSEATVETLEGKTYPANTYFADALYTYNWTPSNKFLVAWGDQLPIPPKLPISMIFARSRTAPNEQTGYQHVRNVVRFRFAQAAHPTQLVLRFTTFKYVLDLSSGTVAPPAPPADLPSLPLSDFTNAIGRLNSNLQVDFGQCYLGWTNNDYYMLPYTVTNTNQLDEEKLTIDAAVWFSSGVYVLRRLSEEDEGGLELHAGPGQTVKNEFDVETDGTRLGWGMPEYLVTYTPERSQYQVYKLECPTKTK